ncbi:tumor necrosis factor receptor [Vaccinia virus]|uniref:Tumor necrosis factor receptor n=1 Tax=Vaccinia virus (strain LC16m0) TaxID=10246 RepID=Q49PC4_VACC0|nr:tumor necrosis factor receptor [Vaccinia virus]BBD06266.1 putative A ORF T [BAC cloning vector pLC16m8.8S-BAC]
MDIKNLLTVCTIFYITTLATADIPTPPPTGHVTRENILIRGIINVVIGVHLENLPRSDVVVVITQNVNAAHLIHIPQSPITLMDVINVENAQQDHLIR